MIRRAAILFLLLAPLAGAAPRDTPISLETPGDHDLNAYAAYLNKVRANPDSKLFRQILAHTHEDKVRFNGYLEGIFLDRISSTKKEVVDWKPAPHKQALGYLIENLPATKNNWALDAALVIVLKSLGGGNLLLREPDSPNSIKVECKPTRHGYTLIYGGVDHSPALITMAQEELRNLMAQRIP